IKTRLLATFRVEADEHLQAITANLLALEQGPAPAAGREVIEATFREVHTLKGAARSVSLMDVEALCQACESVLSRVTRGQLSLSRPLLGRLREAVDGVARLLAPAGAPVIVRELVDGLEQAAAESSRAGPEAGEHPPARADIPRDTPAAGFSPATAIRLAVGELDALLVQAEDLLVLRLAASERTTEARALLEALARCRAAPLESELRAVEARARELLAHLAGDDRVTGGTVGALQDRMRRLRMTPVSSVLDLFSRMVGDLAEARGKRAEWVAVGADQEVDRRVLQAIKDPLIHLVRNAVDHGIESPEARTGAGKPPQGRVAVTVAPLEGNRFEIRVEDDGRGIDPAQVRAAAVRGRLLSSEQAQGLTDEQALDLIYRSGLSTSPMITDVSGHGLGLAIVKERIEQLGGARRSGWSSPRRSRPFAGSWCASRSGPSSCPRIRSTGSCASPRTRSGASRAVRRSAGTGALSRSRLSALCSSCRRSRARRTSGVDGRASSCGRGRSGWGCSSTRFSETGRSWSRS
ncbi:MAG: Hpt domain-containing protein, partial [Candidatus Rokubacteria bacterium]|nr:Hpt domain-containing protein [Candidatus Rokubacteria bacterium]